MNVIIKKWSIVLTLIFLFTSCESKSNGAFLQSGSSKKIYEEAVTEANGENSFEEISNSRKNAITRAIEKASPAIVGINVTELRKVRYRDPFFDDPFFNRFFGNRTPRYKQFEIQGVGSGFLISSDGYILTNHHVAGNASKIIVTMTDGKTYEAEIVGSDQVSDVALLKINADNLPYLKLANSDNIIIGEWVIAFGNPFGLFRFNAKPTVTVGVISNNEVSFIHEENVLDGSGYSIEYRVYKDMIQTDAAISSGNSGGPLLNSMGEVIGVNTVIKSTAQTSEGAGSIGIGFSIPINRVKQILNLIMEKGRINRDYVIGMEVKKIDERIAKYFNLNTTDGVVVMTMMRNSPAMNAGIEPGDIILKVNDKLILREQDYLVTVLDAVVGDKIEFEILRDDKLIKRTMELTSNRR